MSLVLAVLLLLPRAAGFEVVAWAADKPGPTGAKASAPARPARKTISVTPAGTRAAAEKLLRASSVPPGEIELRGLGGPVDDALIAIARDSKVELPIRARAVSALAYTPTRAARAFLFGLVQLPHGPGGAEDAPDNGPAAPASTEKAAAPGAAPPAPAAPADLVLLRRAAVAIGWVGGLQAPDILAPLLGHPDPDVRADAALGLALTRLPRAADLLRARLPSEADPRVRSHIARQLNVIDAALGRAPATR